VSGHPQMIAEVDQIEPVPRRIAVLGGETVPDSTQALYVWEWVNYPQFYIPVADVSSKLLVDESHTQRLHRGDGGRQSRYWPSPRGLDQLFAQDPQRHQGRVHHLGGDSGNTRPTGYLVLPHKKGTQSQGAPEWSPRSRWFQSEKRPEAARSAERAIRGRVLSRSRVSPVKVPKGRPELQIDPMPSRPTSATRDSM
jgi:hypothetical protein